MPFIEADGCRPTQEAESRVIDQWPSSSFSQDSQSTDNVWASSPTVPDSEPASQEVDQSLERVIQAFRRHRSNVLTPQDILEFPLSRLQFRVLRDRLHLDTPIGKTKRGEHRSEDHDGGASDFCLGRYVLAKVRYDYAAHEEVLRIRMPTPLHDIFSDEVIKLIQQRVNELLAEINSHDEDQHPHADIQSLSTADIKLPHLVGDTEEITTKSPDGALGDIHAAFPSFVLETGFSNPPSERSIKNYIRYSNANIQAVLAAYIEYVVPGGRPVRGAPRYKLRLRLYKVAEDPNDLGSVRPTLVFQTSQAVRRSRDASLLLPLVLGDFLTGEAPPHVLNTPVRVTAVELLECLDKAAANQRARDGLHAVADVPDVPARWAGKRMRSETPSEAGAEGEGSDNDADTSGSGDADDGDTYEAGPSNLVPPGALASASLLGTRTSQPKRRRRDDQQGDPATGSGAR